MSSLHLKRAQSLAGNISIIYLIIHIRGCALGTFFSGMNEKRTICCPICPRFDFSKPCLTGSQYQMASREEKGVFFSSTKGGGGGCHSRFVLFFHAVHVQHWTMILFIACATRDRKQSLGYLGNKRMFGMRCFSGNYFFLERCWCGGFMSKVP